VLAITWAIGCDVCHFHWALASPKQVTICDIETMKHRDDVTRVSAVVQGSSPFSLSLPSTLASR
jgi:hypothetical protein